MSTNFIFESPASVFRCAVLPFLFFFISSILIPANSQSIRVLSTKDGLPQSFVSGLVQDDDGFVWIGTRNGLARYDGIQYKIFLHNLHDTSSIAANVIIWINKDSHNHLWIEYESGEIDEMDPVTERINHFITSSSAKTAVRFVRKGWIVDSHGVFWGIIKGAGLNSFDKNKVERYNKTTHGFLSDTLRALLEDRNRKLWVLSQYGISYFDTSSKKFLHIRVPYEQDYNNNLASDEEVVDLHERKNGELMWGDRKRLYFFNPSNKSFRTVALPVYPYFGIRWIRMGSDSTEYFESNGNIYHYDDINGLSPIGVSGMSDVGDARSFLADRSGLLWIGTNAAGIHQIDLVTPFFQSFAYDREFPNNLLQQELGLSMSKVFNWTKKDEIFSGAGYHFRSVYDRYMRLWMALKETVCYYDFLQKKYIKLPVVPFADENTEQEIKIKGITISATGIPFVAGYSGSIFLYDSAGKSWSSFMDPALIRRTFGPAVVLQDIFIDADKLWITTAKDGLLYVDLRSKEIKQLKENVQQGSLPTNQLLGIIEDPLKQDLLWIGSYQGLICLNKKTLKCEVFSLEEGLPDNTIYSIQSDRTGNLWLSTNKGICRFDPQTHSLRAFRASYGLPGDEFNRFHHLKLPDGRLAFGGTEGWTIFDPLTIKNDDFEPRISLTTLKINNNTINPGKNNLILPSPLNSIDKLVLSFSDNIIAIGFAGLQFNQPQDLLYRYRLKGYDDDWVQAGHTHIASYTKIPPGHYTLMVNASNTNGRWSSHIKTLTITIRPPWWRTWWAYLCYSIILFGLVWGYINFRVKRGLLKQEMNLKEKETKQLREIDGMKTRFFSNITHEFRTPLTLILGPAEELKNRHQQDPQQNKLADIIMKNARQLLLLINQLMDLAKLEAKALTPREQIGNPAETISSVVESFENEIQTKKIQFTLDIESVEQNYWFSPEALERIVYNLVSNALKFTPENGEIQIELTEQKKGIRLLVSDTGIGIAADKLPYIFDRFYQAESEESESNGYPFQQGTGIGLALVKELIELQGGKIKVQSRTKEEGQPGTIFTVLLPFRAADDEQPGDQSLEEEVVLSGNNEAETDNRPHILLAEDNAELAEFIKGSLTNYYNVHHFNNGALALENALQLMPDLIISDVLMPVMDGFVLTARLKEDIRTSHIPVILLTAKASQESRIEGLSQGANDYLTKPFHLAELLLRIRNLLEQQRRLREHIRQELSSGFSPEPDAPVLSQDPFLTRTYQLIDDHLDDPLFGVEELVLKMEMSRTSLHRKIKTISDMSTSELIRNYRLKRAAIFLRQGHTSTDTAYLSGFGSPAYFTKCFREVYGMTPGEFIRQGQNVN